MTEGRRQSARPASGRPFAYADDPTSPTWLHPPHFHARAQPVRQIGIGDSFVRNIACCRVFRPPEQPRKFSGSPEATTVTITPVVGTTVNDGELDCLSTMRTFFPDEVDAARFDRTVHPKLYDRLQRLVLSMRVGVIDVVTTSPVNETLTNPAFVAADVAVAGVKIVGAPRDPRSRRRVLC